MIQNTPHNKKDRCQGDGSSVTAAQRRAEGRSPREDDGTVPPASQPSPRYIWLSYPLNSSTPAYGNGETFQLKPDKSIAAGDSCNTASWYLPGNHLGTHVDAPRHFFEQGKTIDSYDPSFWVFNQVCIVETNLCAVVDIIDKQHILPSVKGSPDLLLIKTGMCYQREKNTYWENNPGLAPELGQALRKNCPSLKAVGIDSISISSWQNRETGRAAHRSFLDPTKGKPLLLIEDMDLSLVESSSKITKVTVLPLRVTGADGAPCTVLAELE